MKIGSTMVPSGWLVDPGAGSAMDRVQRDEPDAVQKADIARRGGSYEPLYTLRGLTASAQQDEREALSKWKADCKSWGHPATPEAAAAYIDGYRAAQQVQAGAGAVAAFERWLCSEMPAGTVIGDPKWWAPRILRAALSREQPQPSNGDREGGAV